MFRRSLPIPQDIQETFFLWGPRQTGKTTFLLDRFPGALRFDLLRSSEFFRFSRNPESLGQELLGLPKRPSLVLIDEIQKVPQLLDEVQRMMVEHGFVFGLCGSSARKLRRGHANLLGGRALRFELFGLTSHEVGEQAEVARFVTHGILPRHFLSSRPFPALRAYVEEGAKDLSARRRKEAQAAAKIEREAARAARIVALVTAVLGCAVALLGAISQARQSSVGETVTLPPRAGCVNCACPVRCGGDWKPAYGLAIEALSEETERNR